MTEVLDSFKKSILEEVNEIWEEEICLDTAKDNKCERPSILFILTISSSNMETTDLKILMIFTNA